MPWTLSAFADEAADTADGQIAALKRAGYKHIDVRSVEGHNVSVLPVEVAKAVRAKLDAAGITVAMFGSPLGKIDIAEDFGTEVEKLTHLGRLKGILGCNAVRIFSYYNRKENRPAAAWAAESLRRLKELRKLAGDLGLVLYHENESHIFGDRGPENVRIAAEVRDGKVFKTIFDFDNYNRSGDDVWKNWEALRQATDCFHLKDSDKSGQHVPVGQGNGQVRKILADALQRGFSGPVSLEPHLRHSKAVMATGPGGQENQQFAQMSQADCFHVAATEALKLLRDLQAPVA